MGAASHPRFRAEALEANIEELRKLGTSAPIVNAPAGDEIRSTIISGAALCSLLGDDSLLGKGSTNVHLITHISAAEHHCCESLCQGGSGVLDWAWPQACNTHLAHNQPANLVLNCVCVHLVLAAGACKHGGRKVKHVLEIAVSPELRHPQDFTTLVRPFRSPYLAPAPLRSCRHSTLRTGSARACLLELSGAYHRPLRAQALLLNAPSVCVSSDAVAVRELRRRCA